MPRFDPYHKWLGIRPEEQPANHYRLLGLALFEDDPDTISCAADQRMGHVRSFQTGLHATLSQGILNELAAARVCLLNPSKKLDYDQTLQTQLAPPPPPPLFAHWIEPPTVVEQSSIPDMDFAPTYTKHKKRKRTASRMPWVFPMVGVAVAAVLLVLISKAVRDERGTPKAAATPSVRSKALPKKAERKAEPKVVALALEQAHKQAQAPVPKVEPKYVEPKPAPIKPKLTLLEDPAPLPEVASSNLEEPLEPSRDTKDGFARNEAAGFQKLPVPNDTALKAVVPKRPDNAGVTNTRTAKGNASDRLHLTTALLKKALHGKVAYNSKTGELVLTYDWASRKQLDDFDLARGKPVIMRGVLALRPGDSIRHVVNFQEVKIAAPVMVPTMRGTIIKTSGGASAYVGGANPDTMYLGGGDGVAAMIVPDGQRKGVQPVRLTVERIRLVFEYGHGNSPSQVARPVTDFHAGQVELFGGDVGFQYGMLVFAGTLDTEWVKQLLSQSEPKQ